MLAAPGDADIQAIEVLPVAVDVQVRKITEYLMRPASDRRVPVPTMNVKCNHGLGELSGGAKRGKGGERQ